MQEEGKLIHELVWSVTTVSRTLFIMICRFSNVRSAVAIFSNTQMIQLTIKEVIFWGGKLQSC